MEEIKVKGEYLKLEQLLKIADLVSSGGEAKFFLINNKIYVNDELDNTIYIINKNKTDNYIYIYFGRKARAYFDFGPEFSILTKEEDKTVVTDLQRQTLTMADPRVNPDIETSKYDLSLCAAVGFDLHLEKFHPMLEVRWNYGTHDLYEVGKKELFQRP